MDKVVELLKENSEEKFADFQRKLMPTVSPKSVLGVRTPILRKMAKDIAKEEFYHGFLNELPHKYFEENQLHGFIISGIKDFDKCMEELERFLPYIDNWATCDQTSPKVFKKRAKDLLPYIEKWLKSGHTYTVRFAVGMLMEHFLDERFDAKYLKMAADLRTEEYYIKMEVAWYMATALAKRWDETVKFLETRTMDKWTHNKTIQKGRESCRLTKEQKEYLKTLKC